MPHGHFSHRGQARTSFLSDGYPTAAAAAQHKLGGFFLPLHYYYYYFLFVLARRVRKRRAYSARAFALHIAGKTASKCQAVPTTRGCWENFKRREEKGGAVISLAGRPVYTHKQAQTRIQDGYTGFSPRAVRERECAPTRAASLRSNRFLSASAVNELQQQTVPSTRWEMAQRSSHRFG